MHTLGWPLSLSRVLTFTLCIVVRGCSADPRALVSDLPRTMTESERTRLSQLEERLTGTSSSGGSGGGSGGGDSGTVGRPKAHGMRWVASESNPACVCVCVYLGGCDAQGLGHGGRWGEQQ
jgi:hypothetical protein